MPDDTSITHVDIHKFLRSNHISCKDVLAVEEPLEIQLSYGQVLARATKSISITMRTPGHDEELACGFLLSEGIIQSHQQISQSEFPAGNSKVRIHLAPNVEVNLARLERNFYTTSSCGVCGKSSLAALAIQGAPIIVQSPMPSPEVMYTLPSKLRQAQSVFEQTGGLHASALFAATGELVCVREDVGRHNALDKVIGAQLLAGKLPLHNYILLLSGRASFELMQKALMAGIGVVAAVGAPSSLAVQVAKEFGMTLVGFLRGEQMNVYATKDAFC